MKVVIIYFQIVSILLLSTTIVSLVFYWEPLKKQWIKRKWMDKFLWVACNFLGIASIVYFFV